MANCDSGRCFENEETALREVEAGSRKTVTIHKTVTGFGFSIAGQVKEGGSMMFINGKLHLPLQKISFVTEGGAADIAGLKKDDKILEINGTNMEGAAKKRVWELIQSCGTKLTFTIISAIPQESETLKYSRYFYIDYSNKRTFPISIPEYAWTEKKNREKFVVYKICIAGRHLCSRRYSEFHTFHINLKKQFPACDFPRLPEKLPFSLSEHQLDARRRGLEKYLGNLGAMMVIAENEILKKFFKDADEENGRCSAAVDLKILLPDRVITVVNVCKNSSTEEVYQAVVEKIGMSDEVSQYFRLFEIVEWGFERKLQPNEFPYSLYIRDYKSGTSTCLVIRKWLFTLSKEIMIDGDDMAASFFFWQAIDDINKGQIIPGSKISVIRAFQESSRKYEYLEIVRLLDGYGEISFPHCVCDARKEGQVILTVGYKVLNLRACKDDGTLEFLPVEVTWDKIKEWEIDAENKTFSFQYSRENEELRWVKLFTPHFVFMSDCFSRIREERNW